MIGKDRHSKLSEYDSRQWRSVMEAKYANENPKVRKKTQKVSQNF